MDKQKVITFIQTANKGSPFITKTKLASIMRRGDGWVNNLVEGLDTIPGDQRWTQYFIPDVAERIMERRTQ